MSIEGMWGFISGSVNAPDDMQDGGIVVLETNRVFGGDSAMAYVGRYEIDGENIRAEVKTWCWNPQYQGETVFGAGLKQENHVVLTGKINGDIIEGEIESVLAPGLRLKAGMRKFAELP
jgi:hypothetical protein